MRPRFWATTPLGRGRAPGGCHRELHGAGPRPRARAARNPSPRAGADCTEGRALPLRKGRAIRWIEDALAPLRGDMLEPELRRLVLAIRAAIGIEAFVWLTDVGKLSSEQAIATMRWSARALLRSALVDLGTQPPGRRTSS